MSFDLSLSPQVAELCERIARFVAEVVIPREQAALVIGRIYADIRAFRIYDGASETHRMSIAKRAARRARAASAESS